MRQIWHLSSSILEWQEIPGMECKAPDGLHFFIQEAYHGLWCRETAWSFLVGHKMSHKKRNTQKILIYIKLNNRVVFSSIKDYRKCLDLLSLPPYVLCSVKLGLLIGLWAQLIVSRFNFFRMFISLFGVSQHHNLHDRTVSCQFTSCSSLQSRLYGFSCAWLQNLLASPSLMSVAAVLLCRLSPTSCGAKLAVPCPRSLPVAQLPSSPRASCPHRQNPKGAGVNDLRSKSWTILRQFIQLPGDLLRKKKENE